MCTEEIYVVALNTSVIVPHKAQQQKHLAVSVFYTNSMNTAQFWKAFNHSVISSCFPNLQSEPYNSNINP